MKYLIKNRTEQKARIVDATSPAVACISQGWGVGECDVTELPLSSRAERVKAEAGGQRPFLVVNKITADDWKGFATGSEDAAKQAGWPLHECDIYDLTEYEAPPRVVRHY